MNQYITRSVDIIHHIKNITRSVDNINHIKNIDVDTHLYT